MKIGRVENTVKISALLFPVTVQDKEDGKMYIIPVILTKEQLNAAQLVGQSSKELIYRLCGRKNYNVWNIGKPERKTVTVDLNRGWC